MTDPLPHRRVVGALLLAAVAGAAHAGSVRQLCRFPDGERRVVTQSLGSGFRLAVDHCEDLPSEPRAEPVRQPEVEVDVTPMAVIRSAYPDDGIRDTLIRSTVRDTLIHASVREIRASVLPVALPLPAPSPSSSLLPLPLPVSLGSAAPVEYQRLITRAAQQHGVDPQVVEAVMYVESRFRPDARSNKGAVGLMQLMPATANSQCGVATARLFDPATNIECGVRYLAELTATFAGRVDLAVAAYNAGPGAVMRHGGRVPPFAETRDYVERVLQRLRAAR